MGLTDQKDKTYFSGLMKQKNKSPGQSFQQDVESQLKKAKKLDVKAFKRKSLLKINTLINPFQISETSFGTRSNMRSLCTMWFVNDGLSRNPPGSLRKPQKVPGGSLAGSRVIHH